MKKIILPAVLLIMAACLTACGMPKSSSAESPSETEESVSPAEEGDEVREREGNELSNGENTITVSSSEEVSVTPDIAEVVYCVRTQAEIGRAHV